MSGKIKNRSNKNPANLRRERDYLHPNTILTMSQPQSIADVVVSDVFDQMVAEAPEEVTVTLNTPPNTPLLAPEKTTETVDSLPLVDVKEEKPSTQVTAQTSTEEPPQKKKKVMSEETKQLLKELRLKRQEEKRKKQAEEIAKIIQEKASTSYYPPEGVEENKNSEPSSEIVKEEEKRPPSVPRRRDYHHTAKPKSLNFA